MSRGQAGSSGHPHAVRSASGGGVHHGRSDDWLLTRSHCDVLALFASNLSGIKRSLRRFPRCSLDPTQPRCLFACCRAAQRRSPSAPASSRSPTRCCARPLDGRMWEDRRGYRRYARARYGDIPFVPPIASQNIPLGLGYAFARSIHRVPLGLGMLLLDAHGDAPPRDGARSYDFFGQGHLTSDHMVHSTTALKLPAFPGWSRSQPPFRVTGG
jgi:hypothetical protein